MLQCSSSSVAHLTSHACIVLAVFAEQDSPKNPHDAGILSLHASSWISSSVPSPAGRCPCSGSLPAGHSLGCCASRVQVSAAASQLLLLLEVGLLLGGGVLVLLVLADQVVHVGLRLCELHLVHALACAAQRSMTQLS